MKRLAFFIFVLFSAALLLGCKSLIEFGNDAESITPSKNIISEERSISDVTAIDMRSFGKVNITQGDGESLTITGSDNLLPLVKTSVSGGELVIEMEENISLSTLNLEDVLTFDIQVKDLSGLTVSGLADVDMDSLSTTDLEVVMSGAGQIQINDLSAEAVDVTVSGLGNIELAGKVTKQIVEISGAGGVQNGDLESQEANVNITGLGSATVWVTDKLGGTISGGGSVSYYGNPETNTDQSGLGSFKSLGSK